VRNSRGARKYPSQKRGGWSLLRPSRSGKYRANFLFGGYGISLFSISSFHYMGLYIKLVNLGVAAFMRNATAEKS
jgi:hypothetical protein